MSDPWHSGPVFGGAKKQIAAIVEAEGIVESSESRGPRHFVGTTDRGGTEITLEIRSQQLFRQGEPIDRSPQRVFRRFGLPTDVDLSVLAPPYHTTRANPSRGQLQPTGDADFDVRFQVRSVDPAHVAQYLDDATRSRLLALADVAEFRIDDGQASLHLTYTKLDHEPIRQGLELVAALA
jgi:hypothetical protein